MDALAPTREAPAGAGIWRDLAIAATAIVVSLAGAWAAWAGDAVSTPEARRMIATESPYIADRGAIQLQLAQQTKAIDNLTDAIRRLADAQAKTRQEIALLRARR